jgi:hypothetical protein
MAMTATRSIKPPAATLFLHRKIGGMYPIGRKLSACRLARLEYMYHCHFLKRNALIRTVPTDTILIVISSSGSCAFAVALHAKMPLLLNVRHQEVNDPTLPADYYN